MDGDDVSTSFADLPLALLEQVMGGLSAPEKKRMRLVCKLYLSTANASVTSLAITDASLAAHIHEPHMPNLSSLSLHIASPLPAAPGHHHHGRDGPSEGAPQDPQLQKLQRQFAAVLAASGGEAGALFGAPDRGSLGSSSNSSGRSSDSGSSEGSIPEGCPAPATLNPAQHLLSTWLSTSLPRLRNLASLSWHIGCRQLHPHEWAALIAGLPDGCRSLSLPYHLPPGGRLQYIVELCQRRPGLARIELTGQGNVHQESSFHQLAALGTQLESSHSLHVWCPGLALALPALHALTRLDLSWPGESLPEVVQSCRELLGHLETITPGCSGGLARLRRLSLHGYADGSGEVDELAQALQHLPLLTHLDLFSYDVRRFVMDGTLLQLSRLPGPLAHLGCNGLDLHIDSTCAPHLTSLEVNYTIYSSPMLRHVFPAVKELMLHWLWSQTTRKVAGMRSIESLYLAHPEYVVDWGLLRTLQNLRRLSLAKGSSLPLLASILSITSDLPHLETLEVAQWELTDAELLLAMGHGCSASDALLGCRAPQKLSTLIVSACPWPITQALVAVGRGRAPSDEGPGSSSTASGGGAFSAASGMAAAAVSNDSPVFAVPGPPNQSECNLTMDRTMPFESLKPPPPPLPPPPPVGQRPQVKELCLQWLQWLDGAKLMQLLEAPRKTAAGTALLGASVAAGLLPHADTPVTQQLAGPAGPARDCWLDRLALAGCPGVEPEALLSLMDMYPLIAFGVKSCV